MLHTYHFINRSHSLVLRDTDQVIAWDAQTGSPASEQHGTTEDEQKLWKDSGSPQPSETTQSGNEPLPNVPPPPPAMMMPNHFHPGVTPTPLAQLDNIEQALPKLRADDIAGLKQQVQALADVVRYMAGGRKEPVK